MKSERGCIVMELCAVLLYRVLETGTRGITVHCDHVTENDNERGFYGYC